MKTSESVIANIVLLLDRSFRAKATMINKRRYVIRNMVVFLITAFYHNYKG
jgi:hypothetical protein